MAFWAHCAREPGVSRVRADDTSAHAQACLQSGHLVPQRGVRQCSICKQVAPANGCTAWLRANPCPGPVRPCLDGSIARHDTGRPIHISGRDVHSSHSTHWLVGQEKWACLRCGAGAKHKAFKLSLPCTPGKGGKKLCTQLKLTDAWRGDQLEQGDGRLSATLGCASSPGMRGEMLPRARQAQDNQSDRHGGSTGSSSNSSNVVKEAAKRGAAQPEDDVVGAIELLPLSPGQRGEVPLRRSSKRAVLEGDEAVQVLTHRMTAANEVVETPRAAALVPVEASLAFADCRDANDGMASRMLVVESGIADGGTAPAGVYSGAWWRRLLGRDAAGCDAAEARCRLNSDTAVPRVGQTAAQRMEAMKLRLRLKAARQAGAGGQSS